MKRYHKSRGVNKTGLHLYRHTFAKNWIQGGGDPFTIQKLLGHSSLDIKKYISLFSKDLERNYDNFNPLEKYKNVNSERITMVATR